MSGLPSHWDEKPLGEVVDFVRGVTYKKTQSQDTEQDDFVPLLRATNITEDGLALTDFVYIPEDAVKPSQWLRLGDTLLATSSGSISVVGKSGLVTVDGAYTFGAFCGVLRPSELVNPSFLAYFARSTAVRRRWSDAARGTNINNLKADVVMSTPIPLPPLNEQHRIVAVLEEHLSRLDAAIAILDKVSGARGPAAISGQAHALRKSLLQSALSGNLTRS
jgi:type I restriction enzyme S subunit